MCDRQAYDHNRDSMSIVTDRKIIFCGKEVWLSIENSVLSQWTWFDSDDIQEAGH